ncbi:hypothetical protein [Haliangium ochraceum]|uniref:Uncharacterized protein n=1 Tax=Haliangium ochraceum (strain DSM 14365 / JCM 11303 / SMP-2) TaxID=502025 RepID=D0LLM6_HALO1|nr:hypothetical protein [Haliangium ochraceum]ACY13243.1 hypothetical protein Hoch_0606 [Haliangium ochraceum DSM 14365]
MSKRIPKFPKTIAILGGDGRRAGWGELRRRVRLFPSSRHGGNGSVRRVVAAIGAGTIEHVVLWTRWLGHADALAAETACKRAGVSVHRVRGGVSQMRALLAALFRGGDCG